VFNDILYQGSRDGILYAISSEGKEIWRFKAPKLLFTPLVHNNKIYIGCEDGNLYCLNPEDGKEIWRFKTDGFVAWSPTGKGKMIYFGSGEFGHRRRVMEICHKQQRKVGTSTSL
jgi:outer membrane protein assembly factor BamB